MAQKTILDLLLRRAQRAHIVDDAHRPHAGHHAPGRVDAGLPAQQAVQQAAQRMLGVRTGVAQRAAPAKRPAAAQQHKIAVRMALRQHKIALRRHPVRFLRPGEKDAGGVLRLIPGACAL